MENKSVLYILISPRHSIPSAIQMLIEKLQTYRVEDDELVWFIDYLFRQSEIVANQTKSQFSAGFLNAPF